MRLFIVLLAVLLLAPIVRADTVPIDGYAAIVNDHVITVGDVMNAIQPIDEQLRDTYTGEELATKRQEAFTRGLQALVEEALIVDDFKKKGGQIPERLVNDRINEVINKRFANDRAAFLQTLAEEQITLDEWRDDIRDKLIVQIMRRQEVMDKVRVSPLKAQTVYEANLNKYKLPEKVQLSIIVLNKGTTDEDREAKRQQAVITRGKLLAGDHFDAVARDVSEGPKASDGGDWGWVDPGTLRPELRDVVARLKVDELSDVVEAGDAFYIVKVTGREPARTKSFTEVRDTIESDLKDEEADRLYKDWISRLKQKSYVQVYKQPEP